MRIYGLAEIASELGENIRTVRSWFFRGKLPAPTETLKGGHVWQGEEIESWINDQKGETSAKGFDKTPRYVRGKCPICGQRSPVCDQVEDVQRRDLAQWYASHIINSHKPYPLIEAAEGPE